MDFDYFPFPVKDKSLYTIDVVESIHPDYLYWQLQKEFSRLMLEEELLYRPFGTLSNGEQTKVLLAALFLRDERFLLIDEPTNHLDAEARELVSQYLKSKKGFILISHDRVFLDGCIDHILSINKTNIEIQKGNFSSWYHNKEMQDNFERAENEKLKKDISRLQAAARRTASWSDKVESTKYGTRNSGLRPDRGYIGHKAAKMMQRSKSIEARQTKAIEEKSSLLKNIESAAPLKLSPLSHHADCLVSLSNASIAYGEKTVCQNVCLSIQQGERIAVQGRNGCGKSSLMKLILGENIPFTGELHRTSGLKISYVPQSTAFLQGSLSDYARQWSIDESLFKAILRKLDFSRTQFEKDMTQFSEGQKKKVLIAKSLCEEAHLYIWDEPLNFIDVFSRMQIEELLLNSQPTLLFVEHDRAFADKISTRHFSLS